LRATRTCTSATVLARWKSVIAVVKSITAPDPAVRTIGGPTRLSSPADRPSSVAARFFEKVLLDAPDELG
jgi:hypothetical protein